MVQKGWPKNIHIINFDLGCDDSKYLKNILFGNPGENYYDGVHLRGTAASRHFTYRAVQAVRQANLSSRPKKTANYDRPDYHSDCPQTRYQSQSQPDSWQGNTEEFIFTKSSRKQKVQPSQCSTLTSVVQLITQCLFKIGFQKLLDGGGCSSPPPTPLPSPLLSHPQFSPFHLSCYPRENQFNQSIKSVSDIFQCDGNITIESICPDEHFPIRPIVTFGRPDQPSFLQKHMKYQRI